MIIIRDSLRYESQIQLYIHYTHYGKYFEEVILDYIFCQFIALFLILNLVNSYFFFLNISPNDYAQITIIAQDLTIWNDVWRFNKDIWEEGQEEEERLKRNKLDSECQSKQ
jgi:hypothetical protein